MMNISGATSSFDISNHSNTLIINVPDANLEKIGQILSSDISFAGDISLINCFTNKLDSIITIASQQGDIKIENGEMNANVKSTTGNVEIKGANLKAISTEQGAVELSENAKVAAIETKKETGFIKVCDSEVENSITTTQGFVELIRGSKAKSIKTTCGSGIVTVTGSEVTDNVRTIGGKVRLFGKSTVGTIATLCKGADVLVEYSFVKNEIKTDGGSVKLESDAKVKKIKTNQQSGSVTLNNSDAEEIETTSGNILIKGSTCYMPEKLITDSGEITVERIKTDKNTCIEQKTGKTVFKNTVHKAKITTNSRNTVIDEKSSLNHLHWVIPEKSCEKNNPTTRHEILKQRFAGSITIGNSYTNCRVKSIVDNTQISFVSQPDKYQIDVSKSVNIGENVFEIVVSGKILTLTVDNSANPDAKLQLVTKGTGNVDYRDNIIEVVS
ncbi:DUF4097 family beta strand repeat-containing protein [Sodalis ligni]|nr:DUF4097 family beta strand repeat-containing protein [Sodalis ligni]